MGIYQRVTTYQRIADDEVSQLKLEKGSLHVLYLEDTQQDIEIVREKLTDDFDCPVYLDAAKTKDEYLYCITNKNYDVILADYTLPRFNAEEALKLTLSVCPDVPFICVSGTIGEDIAVELLHQGASDYVLKDRLGRLSFAVCRAIDKITESLKRRAQENYIKAVNERNRLILESIDEGYALYDRDGNILDISKSFAARFGKTVQECIGTKMEDYLPKINYGGLAKSRLNLLKQVFDTGRPVIFEDQRDGHWFYNRFCPAIRDDEVVAVSLFSSDITDRKIAEAAAVKNTALEIETDILRNKEIEYLEILDGSTEASWIYDFKTKTLRYSQGWKERIGGENISAEDMNLYVMNLVHPDDLANVSQARECIYKDNLTKYRCEYRFKIAGEYIWVLDQGKVIYESGMPLKVYGTSMDITERKMAEKERENLLTQVIDERERQKAIISSIEDEVWISDAAGNMVQMNPSAQKAHGLHAEGKSIAEIVDMLEILEPDGTPRLQENTPVLRSLKGETVSGEENVRHLITGEMRYRWFTCSPIRNSHGNITGTVTVSRDITERKQTEEALRESEERFRGVVQNTSAVILRVNPCGIIRFANKRAFEFFGYAEDELIGKPALGTIVPERETTGRDLAVMVKEITAEPYCFPNHVNENIRKNGERVWMEWTNSGIYDSESRLREILAVGTDVTKRKHAEESLMNSQDMLEEELKGAKLLQDISTKLFFEEDIQKIYEKLIDTAKDIMKSDFASIQLLINEGNSMSRLHLQAYRGFNERAAEFWEWVDLSSGSSCGEALRSGRRTIISDMEKSNCMEGTDDQAIYLQTGIHACQTTPLISCSGKLVGMISTHWREVYEPKENKLRIFDVLARQAADIIERKQIEEELRESEKKANELVVELKAADKNKNEFLNALSHELRNPLAAISAGLQILDITQDLNQAANAKEIMNRQMNQLCKLVDDLLDLTRISNNKIVLKKETIELTQFLQLTAEDHLTMFNRKGVRLLTRISADPIHLDVDPVRLKQIIGNLLHNAQKYTSAGDKVVLAVYEEDGAAVLSVKDNGVGIDAQILPLLFQPFMQADKSLERNNGGLGLGLSIVKEIIELHGGTVSVYSEGLGKGSEFIIRLPISRE